MRPRGGRSGNGQAGGAAVEVLAAVGAALVLTLFLVNALFMLYARSVIQHAADVGARAGARAGGSKEDCKAQADQTISELANLYASGASVNCMTKLLTADAVITDAVITARLEPLFPAFGPDWNFTIRATAAADRLR